MNAPTTHTAGSSEARNLRWLLDNLVDEVPGIRSVAVVSSDGLLLLSSDPEPTDSKGAPGGTEERSGPRGSSADLATIVSGVGSLTLFWLQHDLIHDVQMLEIMCREFQF